MPAIKDDATFAFIGAAMEVHRELGPGYLEAAYQKALVMELEDRGHFPVTEVQVPLNYKGRALGVPARADVVVGGVILELKALPALGRKERAQLAHYLKATGQTLGLLINFGASSLEFERVTHSPKSPKSL